jgi:MSHA biogenesis protein MshE
MRLGDLLVQEQIISDDQLQLALQQQRQTGRKLGTTLIDLGFISEVQLLTFLARQLDVPFFDLNNLTIDVSAVALLPEVQARRYRALAVNLSDDKVTVVMSDPADLSALDAIAALLSPRELVLAVAREGQLLEYFDRLYRRTREIENFAVQLHEEHQETGFELGAGSLNAATDEGGDGGQAAALLFEDAVQVGPPTSISNRTRRCCAFASVSTACCTRTSSTVRIAQALVLRLKLVAGLDISEKRLPQDGRFNMKVRGRDVDVRMSTMPVQYGESVVMRLLDQSSGILSLAEDQDATPPS